MDFLHELRLQLDAVRDCLLGDLSAPIEHCPGWTLYDVARHLGNGQLWVATAVQEKRDEHPAEAPSRDDLLPWFEGTCATMLDALSADPDTAAWTLYPPHTVGFWRRRRTHETAIHRWDAEHALGRPARIAPALARDGIAEVFDTMAPRQVALGRAAEPSVTLRVRATDTGGIWLYGAGDPVAEISGTAEDLVLLLWGRLPAEHPGLAWAGDATAARCLLAGSLTP